ncbi:hypothetical protein B0H13DRAFT_1975591 [Mycena leptocephala]|nr:hypothetical protein B0H13DRAFT_1975591 [Mycena leptocephala]
MTFTTASRMQNNATWTDVDLIFTMSASRMPDYIHCSRMHGKYTLHCTWPATPLSSLRIPQLLVPDSLAALLPLVALKRAPPPCSLPGNPSSCLMMRQRCLRWRSVSALALHSRHCYCAPASRSPCTPRPASPSRVFAAPGPRPAAPRTGHRWNSGAAAGATTNPVDTRCTAWAGCAATDRASSRTPRTTTAARTTADSIWGNTVGLTSRTSSPTRRASRARTRTRPAGLTRAPTAAALARCAVFCSMASGGRWTLG